MKTISARRSTTHALILPALLLAAAGGCGWFGLGGTPPAPQGTLTDPVWIAQAENAEPAKFVLYQHEFVYNQARLNWAGEDHLKQIAGRLHAGHNFPVLVERSVTSKLEGTEYKYPVHLNPTLDMQRRAVVVQALTCMNVADAEQRVVVSPSLVRGQEDLEAERAYSRSFSFGQGNGIGGAGGGFGGFGGGGIGGGFGS